jgi:hypothetical protein
VSGRLIDVVPQDRAGREGLKVIIAETSLAMWIDTNAARLVEEGYTRLVVVEHRPTAAVGDRRA